MFTFFKMNKPHLSYIDQHTDALIIVDVQKEVVGQICTDR